MATMPLIVHTVLNETPLGATVTPTAYRDRAYATNPARNVTDTHAADLLATDAKSAGGSVAPDTYSVVEKGFQILGGTVGHLRIDRRDGDRVSLVLPGARGLGVYTYELRASARDDRQ